MDGERPKERTILVGVISGVGGAALGFLLGVASRPPSPDVVPTSRGSTAPAAPAAPAAATTSNTASATAAPSRLVSDFGTNDARLTLSGSWTPVQIGPHRARSIAAPGSASMALAPLAESYTLAVVARTEADHREVSVRVNAEKVGSWGAALVWRMHALVVPQGTLKPGVNTIEFVPSPTQGGPASIAIASLHLGPLETSAHADASGPTPSGSLMDGYYAREGEGERAMSWSAAKRTEVALLLKPLNAPYRIELAGMAFGPLQPLLVHARVNERDAGSAKLENMATYTFDVPTGALVEGSNVVELTYEKTLKPRDVDPKSKDPRDIAVRIKRISVKPVTAP